MTGPRTLPPRDITEAELQAQAFELARMLGWRTMHVRRSIGKGRAWTTTTSLVGWPDAVFMRPPDGFFFVEFKSEHGKVTAAQEEVHELLRACGQTVLVVRPADFEHLAARLQRRAVS